MKVIVIGGNAAGMSAASRIKRKCAASEVTVFERTEEVSYGACGMPYFIGGANPSLDLMRIRPASEFCEQGIDLRVHTEVTKVDFDNQTVISHDVVSNQDAETRFDRLIVSTGASPIVPPIDGTALPGVFTLKTLANADAIKTCLTSDSVQTVAIIGGGYIGIELAEACMLQNRKVHVFESLPRLMNVFDPEFGVAVQRELTESGADVHLGERVQALCGEKQVETIVTDKGKYPTDMVLIAVGVRPNTSFLDHPSLNKLSNGALIVDVDMQTSIKGVFAAGDCASVLHRLAAVPMYLPLGTNANKQGRFAADSVLGIRGCGFRALGTTMIRCLGLELAKTGLTEQEALSSGWNAASMTVQTKTHARYFPCPKPITIKLCYEKDSHRLLGAQLMGRGESAWRIDVFACAIDRGMRTEELGMLDLGYAPPFASVWDAIQIAANAVK